MSNNVVSFPKAIWQAPANKEEADKRLEEFKDAMLELFLDEFVPFVLARMNIYGVLVENPHDIALISQSIKSAVMRSQNRIHPLQQFAEESFTFVDEEQPAPTT